MTCTERMHNETYPYSRRERPLRKKAGQVSEERSPVKLMTVFINSLNWLPVPGSACLTESLSTSLTDGALSGVAMSLLEELRLLEKKDLPMADAKPWKKDARKQEKQIRRPDFHFVRNPHTSKTIQSLSPPKRNRAAAAFGLCPTLSRYEIIPRSMSMFC